MCMMEPHSPRAFVQSPALRIATLAVLTAVTTVFTYVVRIPIAPTRGYLNLGDVAIYFTAFTFGPVSALISGGLGTALADLISGYAQWAPISLLVHGLQGLVAALLGGIARRGRSGVFNPYWLLGGAAGLVLMCGGYLLSGSFMVGFGAALVELPGNVLQNLAGLAGGIPLAMAVHKAYPPVEEMRW
jgi:uncharacterized membrane protein